MKKRVLAVIPARFSSSRFRGKVLANLAGKPVVRHVYERTAACGVVDRVVIATDDSRVAEAVAGFGGDVVMTSPDHRCGSERTAEVASQGDWPLVLNVQGDEPLIVPESIRGCVERLLGDESLDASTLATEIRAEAEADSPHVVKVVVDLNGRALYFSRSPIPFASGGARGTVYKHIGVYCYRREYLLSLVKLDPGPLEKSESLEQLRILEHGGRIGVAVTPFDTVGIDVPEDLVRAERALASAGSFHG